MLWSRPLGARFRLLRLPLAGGLALRPVGLVLLHLIPFPFGGPIQRHADVFQFVAGLLHTVLHG